MKGDLILLKRVSEKFLKVSINEFAINLFCCVSPTGFTWQIGMKYTGMNLQILQDNEIMLLLQNNIRGRNSIVMRDRYKKSDANKIILNIDATNIYVCAMSETLPYDEIKFDKAVNLYDILSTRDGSDIGNSVECDCSYPDYSKEKSKNLHFGPGNKINPQDKFGVYMNEMKPKNYTKNK